MTRLLIALSCLLAGCINVEQTYDKIPAGTYRGVFYLDGRLSERREPDKIAANFNLDEVPQAELPVMIEVAYAPDGALEVVFLNGEERVKASRVEFERLMTSARDSITIHFPLNDSYITGYHEEGTIEGLFVDESRGGSYRIPFTAFYGVDYRFTDLQKAPGLDMSGRWATTFSVEDAEASYPAVAEFEQRGNRLTGTFLTTTGDYRYLDGTVQGNRFYLSTFDGGHVFLFAGKIEPDSSLIGIFRSGNDFQTIWTARRDAKTTLPDASRDTEVTTPGKVDIGYYDAESGRGSKLSELADAQGKYKLVTLMGSWCPNCRDEALFLDSLRQNPRYAGKLAVVGLAFEKFRDTARAVKAVARFGESLNLGFPIYVAGFSDKAEATASLGFVKELKSYPTMLLLDPEQRIVFTHTGFTGPATSEYGAFAKTFAAELDKHLAQ